MYSVTFISAPGNQHNLIVYGGHSKYCVICSHDNPITLTFCTISPTGDLVEEFSVNSPRYPITGFMWHPNDPSIFFTQTEGCMLNYHRIIKAEQRVDIIGTTNIGDSIILFKLNSTGTKMVVVLHGAETANIFNLHQSEDGSMNFELVSSSTFDECGIYGIDFFEDIIAYGLTDGTVHIDCIGEDRIMHVIDQNLGEVLAVQFSPNGKFLAIAAEYGVSIYRFSSERFTFHLIGEFVNDGICTKNFLQWHDSLPLLVGTFVRQFSGVYGMTEVMFLGVSDSEINQIHSQIFQHASLCGIFIHPTLPLAICGYYGTTHGEVLVWNFKNSVRFPLERLLLMRNALYKQDLPEDIIEQVLRKTFGSHLSFEKFKHHCSLPPVKLLPPSKESSE